MGSDGGRGSSPGLIIAYVCSCSWVVVSVHACSPSIVHIHLHLCPFVYLFMGVALICGQLCSFLSVCIHLWAVITLARCGGGGLLVGGGGGDCYSWPFMV